MNLFYNTKNQKLIIGNTDMDYISFGNGKKNLIIIPGLGDALNTVKGAAIPFALMYRIFAKDYRVYVFSRKNQLEQGYTTKDMADDQAAAIKRLGISKADVMGVSLGGMIAQHLAIDHPELVEKLVLAVTLCKTNDTMQGVIHNWIELANANDFKGILIDTAEKSYSKKRLKAYRPLYSILSKLSKPKSLDRFLIQANACISHDALNKIGKIQCPALVIGGEEDKIVGVNSSMELAEKMKDSELFIYAGLGHAAYEEAKDFNSRVLNFLAMPMPD